PPYHAPVFVLTHYEREPIELAGGTTFYFIGDGFDSAFARASEAAGDRGVDIAGGASTVRQALAAGVIDELVLDFVPVLLGSGERLFDGVADPGLEPVEVIHSRRTCDTASAGERGWAKRARCSRRSADGPAVVRARGWSGGGGGGHTRSA